MDNKLVKIKNKSTGLFWYGFGEKINIPNQFNFKETKHDDVNEHSCTHFDLNNKNEAEYVENNFNPLKHEYIFVD